MILSPECHAAFFTGTGLTQHNNICIGYVPDVTVPALGVGSNQSTALPAGFFGSTTTHPRTVGNLSNYFSNSITVTATARRLFDRVRICNRAY